MHKKFLPIVLVLVFVLSVGTCKKPGVQPDVGVTDDTILLGTFQDMSGPAAYLGKLATTTINVWIKYVNEELGGIHGRKLKIVVEDNKYDPVLTKTAFNKLVNQHKVFAIVMVYGSTPCTAIFEDIEREKIPVFPTAATAQSMFDPPKRYLFWYANSDQDNGIMMVDYLVKDLKLKKPKIGICYQDDEWGKDALKGVEIGCKEYGLKAVGFAPYKRGTKNLNPQAMKLKAKGVTHCFFAGYAPVYAALLTEANKIGWKPVFFGDYVTVDPRAFIAGKLADGHYHFFNLGLRHEGTPGWKKIEKLFTAAGAEKLLNVPLVPLLWNPMLLLTKALQDCGRDLTREKLIDAIEKIKDFDTEGLGKIEFGPNMRKGTHYYRILKANFDKKIFVPVTDWRQPSLVWGKR
jgi:branched-chain amino acid transport system substrate-binding protein